ncbi:LysR family transcriptional regulator [Humidisolicoccus flavus]|uniref:LysR family transcriptional regulator n=1 Tax=Humidisolicoccus flavus TaxID=3111414 RepID=UPI00325386FC
MPKQAPSIDVKRLRLLRELSTRGTISAVAEALNFSPSSVSQQLATLEREAKVELIRKSGRGLQLTHEGEVLVSHASEIFAAIERAESALAATLPEVTGTVRLAVFQTAALALLPRMLHSLRELHPLVRAIVVQREPETALRETWARDFDLVVAEQYPGHAAPHYEELDRQPLVRDRIRLAVAEHSDISAFAKVTTLQDAAALPWVMEPSGAASRHFAEQACRSAGFEPDVRYETADLQAHVQLVESGNAVALLPDLVWATRRAAVKVHDLPGKPERELFTARRHASENNPATRAVREALELAAKSLRH